MRALCGVVVAFLFSACAGQLNKVPELSVTKAQGESLQAIVMKVNRQVLELPPHKLRLTKVRSMVANYDGVVRSFLSEEQYVQYEENYRDYLAERLFDEARNTDDYRAWDDSRDIVVLGGYEG